MRSIVVHAAKDLRIEDQDVGLPGPGQLQIKMAVGGICGSDLHYYNHGGIGDSIRLKEPMILGHEVAGHVGAIGEGVSGFVVGDLVAVSPSRPDYTCRQCQKGLHNHCENMRFYGSAMPFPHSQGAFSEMLVAQAMQCVRADGLNPGEAAIAEPLAVCLHAARRAGDLIGKRVLITGSGPIGTLCILAARAAGASEIVITDLSDTALEYARAVGVDSALNMAKNPDALKTYSTGKGYFDAMFECSGSPAALAGAVSAMAPRSVIMQLGLGGDMKIPVQAMTAKEIDFRGSFRFHEEFATAVRLMQLGRIDVKPLISHTIPMDQAVDAFELASDRSKAMKVQLAFN
jgi:L-idonate 5-dehydrogenase